MKNYNPNIRKFKVGDLICAKGSAKIVYIIAEIVDKRTMKVCRMDTGRVIEITAKPSKWKLISGVD